jgi:cytochrome c-type biogenesis protein CcsB
MNGLWLIPALICYLAAAVGFTFGHGGADARRARQATIALGLGAALQTAALAAAGVLTGNIPVTDFAESVAFLSWLTAIAGLILIVRLRIVIIGGFVAPAVFAATAVAAATIRRQPWRIPRALRSAWLPVHVTLAFAGFALFLLAAAVSVAYLICERRLKAKRPLVSADGRTPSLEKLDRINYRLLSWGFVMLTFAIITGAIWADATWGHFWSWEPQEFWSFVIWLMYAGLLESRLTAGWRGRRVATLTIAVLTILIGSFLGVSLLSPGKHGGSFG